MGGGSEGILSFQRMGIEKKQMSEEINVKKEKCRKIYQ